MGKIHFNREIMQKAWENIRKEMRSGSNRNLNVVDCVITVPTVWDIAQ
jgi:hypothetical protein